MFAVQEDPICGGCDKKVSKFLVVALHTKKGPTCVDCWYIPRTTRWQRGWQWIKILYSGD